jgi:hypothetical protein
MNLCQISPFTDAGFTHDALPSAFVIRALG